MTKDGALTKIEIIGAGLAGCEAAWQLAIRGYKVTLVEMKPHKKSPAHSDNNFAELVCSNSLKANDVLIASGLLKEELRILGSLLIKTADENAVEAGNALAVNRIDFAKAVTDRIKSHPNIVCIEREQISLPDGVCIVATGPLTDGQLMNDINRVCGETMSFFDAASPIVTTESLDLSAAFYGSRYNKGTPDYINCPLTEEEYKIFWEALTTAETAKLHDFENINVFEGCMPVEVMAKRGFESLRFGPFKPVGLYDPSNGKRHYAVLQLRKENKQGTIYNLVGCQTNLTFPEQKKVFGLIPALRNAEFARYGVMHRNSYINSPKLLSNRLNLRARPDVYFAGQITGVEGYVESIATGLLAALNIDSSLTGKPYYNVTNHTMIGALAEYITDENIANFQPMNANFGLLGFVEHNRRDKKDKKQKSADLSLQLTREYMEGANGQNNGGHA